MPTGFEIYPWRIIAETQQIPHQIRQVKQVKDLLNDVQIMSMRLAVAAPEPKITATSGPLMTMFMVCGLSKKLSQNPRATTMNDGISGSHYNGTHTALSRTWLCP